MSALESMLKGVLITPSAGEFVYGTQEHIKTYPDGREQSTNRNVTDAPSNFIKSIDQLAEALPGLETVSLVVSWFGTDLRAGDCEILPMVEEKGITVTPTDWAVETLDRTTALLLPTGSGGDPIYGGTPSDQTIVEAIVELKSRGYRVTFYPFILMTPDNGNTLPDPYSDNASVAGQPPLPWRGRITCSPAPGFAGTVDKTAAAAAQINNLLTRTWGYRRMILHYGNLCADPSVVAAGGIDAFCIGSELVGLTTVRSGPSAFPFVDGLVTLAADVRALLPSTEISYASDWTECKGYAPADGSGDFLFNLDPLWASPNVDFIGIDNYAPLSDWRDGSGGLDGQNYSEIYDLDYLMGNIEGGEGYDWFYSSLSNRDNQVRTPITDGAYSKPWVFRVKDLRGWWQNQHYNRIAGVEDASPTAWVPESKVIRFTEFGSATADKSSNQPNAFFDSKSSESRLPYYSNGNTDALIVRRLLRATLTYWGDLANNPASGVYPGRMMDTDNFFAWTWDARPFPAFPYGIGDGYIWDDGTNYPLGVWLNGRLGLFPQGAADQYSGVNGEWRRAVYSNGELDGEMLASHRRWIGRDGQWIALKSGES